MPAMHFETTLYAIDSWVILHLPQAVSAQLPSRGQTMIKGTINGTPFQTPLEPDGNGSHWFRVGKSLQEAAGVGVGDTVALAIESTKEWPEPEVPADIQAALVDNPQAYDLWKRITPMAHWDWLRWIGSTKQPETRQRRIEVACSKLVAGERRPCCFNRNVCTVPEVSKNGALLEPDQTTT